MLWRACYRIAVTVAGSTGTALTAALGDRALNGTALLAGRVALGCNAQATRAACTIAEWYLICMAAAASVPIFRGGFRLGPPKPPRFPRTAPSQAHNLSDRGPNDFRGKSAQNAPASNQPMKIGTLAAAAALLPSAGCHAVYVQSGCGCWSDEATRLGTWPGCLELLSLIAPAQRQRHADCLDCLLGTGGRRLT